MARLVWAARCRSGYQFERLEGRRRVWRPCRRVCSRGELLCGDCATAVAVPTVAREGWVARTLKSMAAAVRPRPELFPRRAAAE
jgi:hypothetical protein